MIRSSDEKKKLFYMIVLILTLITMIIGATIAYFHLVASQKEDSTVLYTGTLQIAYIDGVYIQNPVLYPMKTVYYNSYEDVYRNDFAVTSTGTLDQIISVDLYVTNNTFVEHALKYAIFNSDGKEMTRGYVPLSGTVNLTNNLYLAHDATAKYTLIIWLNDGDYNQNALMGSQISGRIDIYAKQVKY